uniref:Uncharacterized protein n=1 Tax=Anopheles triannulatus TaxID=58253 RepID=A0A2M4ARD5_9DIPT
MTSSIFLTMAGWTSDKFRLSCLDNNGLKRTLLKMLILDNGTKNTVSAPHRRNTGPERNVLESLLQFSLCVYPSHWMRALQLGGIFKALIFTLIVG